MTPEQLFSNIILAYRTAREAKFPDPKIRRGGSHSISSETEDLFAKFLILNDPSVDMIRVDQTITLPANPPRMSKHKTFKPDLVLIRNGAIDSLIDIKMDIGYNRNGLPDLCTRHAETVSLASGRTGNLKDGQTKESFSHRFSQNLTYSVVLISGLNSNKLQIQKDIMTVQALEPAVEVFVLSKGLHLNDYRWSPDIVLSQVDFDEDIIANLLKKI